MPATYATLDELRTAATRKTMETPAWMLKMLHRVPDLPTIPDRTKYVLEKVRDEVVLDLGCTGPLSAELATVAKGYYGVDKQETGWPRVDLDVTPEAVPVHADVTLLLALELLEHLANPGRCLDALRRAYPTTPLLLSVPQAGAYRLVDDQEMVNAEHVAWYSYTTLATLLRRSGYAIEVARWYHGAPHKAEGLLVRARPA